MPSSHKNPFGPKTTAWLASIGVRTLSDVERLGSVQIYRLLQRRGYPVSLNLVYALEGAMLGLPWNRIPPLLKMELRMLLGKEKKL